MIGSLIPQQVEVNPFRYYGECSPIYESPETVLAREAPLRTLRMLEAQSIKRHYEELGRIGASITNTYTDKIPPENIHKFKGIKFQPKVNFGGFFNKSYGMVITFEWER